MLHVEILRHEPQCWTDGEMETQQWLTLTGLTDGAAVVGFVGGVDTVGGGAVGDSAVHLPVGLAATSLTPGQLQHTQRFYLCQPQAFHISAPSRLLGLIYSKHLQ